MRKKRDIYIKKKLERLNHLGIEIDYITHLGIEIDRIEKYKILSFESSFHLISKFQNGTDLPLIFKFCFNFVDKF